MYNSDDVLQLLITDFKFYSNTDKDLVSPFMYALKKGLYKFVSKSWFALSAKDTYKNNIIHYCCGDGVEIPVFGGTQSLTVINKDNCLQFIKSIIKQEQEQGKSYKSFDIYHNTNGMSTLRCALESKLDNVAAWMLSQPKITSLALKQESNQTLGEIGKYGIKIVNSEKPLKYSHAIHVILERLLINDTHFTLQEMKNEISQYVKNYRLDVNSTDHNGMTVLHYLCYNKYKQEAYGFKEGLIKLFVDLGTDPEIRDIRGYTALMCAVEKGLVKLSDYTDPRVNNEAGIGKLLNARGRIQKTVPVGDHPALGVTGQQVVKQADVWTCPGCQQHPGEIRAMCANLNKLENKHGIIKDIVTVYSQNQDEMKEKFMVCHSELHDYKVRYEDLKGKSKKQWQSNKEIQAQIEQKFENQLKHLELKFEEKLKYLQVNHDKEIERIKDLNEHLQNSVTELEQKLEYQVKQNETLNSHLEDIEKDLKENSLPAPPVGDLLIGDTTIMEAYRHLEEGTEVISLPDAGAEEIEATLRKENKTYASVTIVTGNKDVCTERPVDELTELYKKLLTQAKTKSGRVVMSSLLPSVGGHGDCKRIETLNPVLNDVCTQLGVVFVDNDKNFKFMDGSVNEDFYSEDGEKLTKAGIKRLLKNLGLTAKRATRGGPSTNI